MIKPKTAAEWVSHLEQSFQQIAETRMQGLPVINPNLHVKAFGFKRWQQYRLGVLLSPWFMNIVLLPLEASSQALQVGTKQVIALPSGEYEFILGFEAPIGFYLSCSLFSPVFEFENQAAAETTAEIALLTILKQEKAAETEVQATLLNSSEPLSRRELLQGQFLRV